MAKPSRRLPTVKTVDQIARASALRSAGFSVATIAEKTNISPSTLNRHFKSLAVTKGGVTKAALATAKQEMLDDGLAESLKGHIMSVIADDISAFKSVRSALIINLEEVMDDSTLAPHYKARALTAIATGLSVSQTMIRKTLAIDSQEIESDELPELTIHELSATDIEDMRTSQLKVYSLDGVEEEGEIIEEGEPSPPMAHQ